MTRRLAVPFALLAAIAVSPPARAETVHTRLDGYQETPLTLDTQGSGRFKAKIDSRDRVIEFDLSYEELESAVTQAHIHFGRPAIGGGIVLFLCTNLGNAPGTVPTPQSCPPAPATITGTLTPADVIAVPGQGITGSDAGFDEVVLAIRARAAYVNVHTAGRPGGEIRGQIRASHGHWDDD
jgi:hypothetical protein